MSKNIKGIVINIGGETTGLDKALKGVNDKSIKMQSELKQVQRLLKFDPNNVELMAQKQELLTQQVANTTDKLDQLKNAEKQVQEQFEKGDISQEQYRAFRREIEQTKNSLTHYTSELSKVEQEQEDVTNATQDLKNLFTLTSSSVDDFSDALGSKLTNAIKSGTASSKQLEDAIQKIAKESLECSVTMDKLRDAIKQADSGVSLDKIKKELQQVAGEAEEAEQSVEELGGELSGLAGGIAAGIGLGEIIQKSLDTSSMKTKIDIAFDVPESSKESVKQAIKSVEVYGVESEEALAGVRRQWALNKDATDESNAAVVKMAGAITTAYAGLDFNELIQEGNEIAATLGLTNEEATGLVNSLLKTGFPPEQLDIIAEYGDQMIMAGFNAKEVQAIMAAGVDTKTWNIDNLLDKEMSL